MKSSRALSQAASTRPIPFLNLSIYPSIVMMESSTIIPKTAISAARVTVLSSIPATYITAIVAAVQIGTPELAIRAERIGKRRSITIMTTIIEIKRSLRKSHTDCLTTFGWSVILVSLTLSGRVWENSSSTLSTFLPKEMMLFSGRIDTESIRAVLPL